MNAKWKIGVAVVAVMSLSAPAAVGVYSALVPTRGMIAAGLAALGIELTYLSLALLAMAPALRSEARRVAVLAVATSITLNSLADYAARVPGGLSSSGQALALFDPLALGLSVLESAPLAGLAYALATLLHRLAEEGAPAEVVPETAEGHDTASQPETLRRYTCKKCGTGGFAFAELGRHSRQCKGTEATTEATAAAD
jgi:hypothetical protein